MILWNKFITSVSYRLGNVPSQFTQLLGSKVGIFFPQVSDFKSIAVFLAIEHKEENTGGVNTLWAVTPFVRVC